jgi:predicted RNA-binding protein with TRAM domain
MMYSKNKIKFKAFTMLLLLAIGIVGFSSFVSSPKASDVILIEDGKACHVYGKIKFVEYGEDYKVKIVDYGEDLKIKYVDYGEDKEGKWKTVEYGEKYKIKIVEYGEDFKMKEVDYGEGC